MNKPKTITIMIIKGILYVNKPQGVILKVADTDTEGSPWESWFYPDKYTCEEIPPEDLAKVKSWA